MTSQPNGCGDHCADEEVHSQTLDERIRSISFQRLLTTQQPVSMARLADELGEPPERIDAAVSGLDRKGLIRRNHRGEVVGSVGLSVEPSRHELSIGDQRFWTWCAYDAVGILAALGASGQVRSKSPLTGVPINLQFRDGSPEASDAVLFLPDTIASQPGGTPEPAPGVSVFDDWCPLANLFENRAASLAWAERRRVHGQTLSLAQAAVRGANHWRPIVPAQKQVKQR